MIAKWTSFRQNDVPVGEWTSWRRYLENAKLRIQWRWLRGSSIDGNLENDVYVDLYSMTSLPGNSKHRLKWRLPHVNNMDGLLRREAPCVAVDAEYNQGDCQICRQKNVKVKYLECGIHMYCRMCAEFIPRLAKGDLQCKVSQLSNCIHWRKSKIIKTADFLALTMGVVIIGLANESGLNLRAVPICMTPM